MKNKLKYQLPSQHQVNDNVLLSIMQVYGNNPFPCSAEVKAVHFYEGKVKYDLEINMLEGESTRIYNIDSCFVLKK